MNVRPPMMWFSTAHCSLMSSCPHFYNLSTLLHYNLHSCSNAVFSGTYKWKHWHGKAVNLRPLQIQTLWLSSQATQTQRRWCCQPQAATNTNTERTMLSSQSQLDLDSAVAAACVQASCQHGHNLLSAGKLNELTSQELWHLPYTNYLESQV